MAEPPDPRLDALEATARRLEAELAELKTSLRSMRGETPGPAREVVAEAVPHGSPPTQAQGPAKTWEEVMGRLGAVPPAAAARPATAPPPPAPRPAQPRADRRGMEELVGRYGTIGLATLTILMGIGALLGWAIRNGYIGPTVRVILGLVAAAVLAGIGWRVRRGDSPRYGNALLALSLAVVHVVAWGAGPRLQLIGTGWVLALAALASTALAGLAWHEDDQALFNVGFGGALLAPFVTSSGGGNAVMLLTYGFIVLMAGIASLGQRSWTKAPWVASAAIVWYAAVGETMVDGSMRWAVVNAPGAFALGLGALSIVLLDGKKRAAVVWPALLAALVVLVAVADSPANDDPQLAFAVGLALAAMAAGDRERRGVRGTVLGALVLPLGATALALGTLTDVTSGWGALIAVAFAGLSAWAAWKDLGGERGTWAFTATIQLGLAIPLAADGQQLVLCIGIAVFGVASALVTQRWKEPGIGLAGALWMAAATAEVFQMLQARERYAYTPFLTQASVAAAALSAAWVLLSWHTARSVRPGSVLAEDLPRSAIRVAGWVVAFFWVRQELARAVSPDVSGFLLVAWYAVSGVGSIFIGRARGLPMLRQVGLGLSLFAALTALTQATSLAIGWRVASYLLTGAFLLGVAWSYRITRLVSLPAPIDPLPAPADPVAPAPPPTDTPGA